MLKIGSIRWKGRCHKHPMYDPEIDGLGGVRGGCQRCEVLLEIFTHHAKLVRLMREFGSRADNKAKLKMNGDADRQLSLLDSL
jgi:hypothetical protein